MFGFLIPLSLVGGIGAMAVIVPIFDELLPVMRATVNRLSSVGTEMIAAAIGSGGQRMIVDCPILGRSLPPATHPEVTHFHLITSKQSVGESALVALLQNGNEDFVRAIETQDCEQDDATIDQRRHQTEGHD